MSFFKNALYLLSANALVMLLSVLLRPLTARFLGPSEYGLFALILTTASVIPAFTLFSLNSGVLYFVSKKPGERREIVSSVLSLSLLVSIIAFFPLELAILAFAPSLGVEGYAAAFALSIALALFSVLQASQQGLENFKQYSSYSVASSFLAGALALGVALHFGSGLYSAIARAGAIFFVSLAGLFALKSFGRFDWRSLKSVFKYSAPLGFAGLVAAFIAVVDRYFLAAFKGTAEVGYYDIGYAMVAAVLPFSGALLTIMMPRVIRQQQNLGLYYKKLGEANVLVLSTIGLFFFYYSEIIVTFLLGSEFDAAALPFKILAFALPLMAFYGLNGASMDAVAKTKMSGLLAALLTLFSIAFNYALVPSLGAVGAAYANFLTYAFVVCIGWYYLKSRRNVELKGSLMQYAIFFVFALAYLVFLEKGGFVLKGVAFAAFVAASALANKKLIAEILSQARFALKSKG